jgi:hypothetical protein
MSAILYSPVLTTSRLNILTSKHSVLSLACAVERKSDYIVEAEPFQDAVPEALRDED